jgi:hypothetical protein
MTTTTTTSDTVVRIYEVGILLDDNSSTTFTISLSMPFEQSLKVDRDGDAAHDEAWNRAKRVMKRDEMKGTVTAVTFVRERLIQGKQAKSKVSTVAPKAA